jgi:subtilisin-like proprotein convertase family protein
VDEVQVAALGECATSHSTRESVEQMNKIFLQLAKLAVLALPYAAQAAPIVYNGSGGLIPDNTPAGINFDIVIGDTGTIASFDRVSVDMSHTWVGDLIFSLTHLETGTSVIFLDRIQSLAPGSTGDSSNLGKILAPQYATYAFQTDLTSYTFSANSIWGAATLISDSSFIPSGVYAASGNARTGDPLSSYVPTNLNAFAGESIAGTWRLNISDHSEADLGVLHGWQIQATTAGGSVPEPTSLVLVFSAIPAIAILRRRK